eukprot:403368225
MIVQKYFIRICRQTAATKATINGIVIYAKFDLQIQLEKLKIFKMMEKYLLQAVVLKSRNYIHLKCQRWHPEIKIDHTATYLYATKNFNQNENKTIERCYICKDKKSNSELLSRCLVKNCTNNECWFHPTCLTEKVEINNYQIISYKSNVEGSGNIKKIGILCKYHSKEEPMKELSKQFAKEISEPQRIQIGKTQCNFCDCNKFYHPNCVLRIKKDKDDTRRQEFIFYEEGIICKMHKRSMYKRQRSAQSSYLQERDIYVGSIPIKKTIHKEKQNIGNVKSDSLKSSQQLLKQDDQFQDQDICQVQELQSIKSDINQTYQKSIYDQNKTKAKNLSNQNTEELKSEEDTTVDPEEDNLNTNYQSRQNLSLESHFENQLSKEVERKEQKQELKFQQAVSNINLNANAQPQQNPKKLNFEFELNQLIQNQANPFQSQPPPQPNQNQLQNTACPQNYQNTIGNQNNYFIFQPTQQYFINNPTPAILQQLQPQVNPQAFDPQFQQFQYSGLGAAMINSNPCQNFYQLDAGQQLQQNQTVNFNNLQNVNTMQVAATNQIQPQIQMSQSIFPKKKRQRQKQNQTQNIKPAELNLKVEIPKEVQPPQILQEQKLENNQKQEKSKKNKKKKKDKKKHKHDDRHSQTQILPQQDKTSQNQSEQKQRKRDSKAQQHQNSNSKNQPTSSGNQSRNLWWQQIQRSKSRKREPFYNKTQKMRSITREEERLQHIQIDWNNYRQYFSKVTKNDMDYIEYHMMSKKVKTEDLINELILIESDVNYKSNQAQIIQELQALVEKKKEDIKDEVTKSEPIKSPEIYLINEDQISQNKFNIILENQTEGKFSLIFFREKALDNIIQSEFINEYKQIEQMQQQSGGLGGCIFKHEPIQTLNLQESKNQQTLDVNIKNAYKLKSPRIENEDNKSQSQYYVHNIIEFPEEAKDFINLLQKRNQAITYSHSELLNSKNIEIDEVNCMILANNYLLSQLQDDIKAKKDQLMRNIRRQKNDAEDHYEQMKNSISSQSIQVLFNQVLGNDQEIEGNSQEINSQQNEANPKTPSISCLSIIEDNIMQDESTLFDSMYYCERSSFRAQSLWSWQTLYKTFELSFQPSTTQLQIIIKDPLEVPYACMCCFLSIYDNLNPIVYCDMCDGGVHQRCYGIEDLDEPFFCDLCIQRKKRLDVEVKKKEMVCLICQKSGCMMKLEQQYLKNQNIFFHPFCLFTTSSTYYKNIYKMKGIAFDQKILQSLINEDTEIKCDYCDRIQQINQGVIEYCFDCKTTKFHSMCAWVKGCNFQVKRLENDTIQDCSLFNQSSAQSKQSLEIQIRQNDEYKNTFYKEAFKIQVQITCKKCRPVDLQIRQMRRQKYQQIEKNLEEISKQKQKEIEEIQRKLFKDIDESSVDE